MALRLSQILPTSNFRSLKPLKLLILEVQKDIIAKNRSFN